MSFYATATGVLRPARNPKRLVEPVVHSPKRKPRRAHLAMSSRTLTVRKSHQHLRASQMIVQLLRLAPEEHVILRIANQRRTCNLFRNPVAQMELERSCQIRSRTLRSHAVHAVR